MAYRFYSKIGYAGVEIKQSEVIKMAKVDLTKYGITGTTEIVYNPSYELLFEEETKAGLEGYEVGKVTDLDTIRRIRSEVKKISIDEKLMDYLVTLIRSTRENEYIALGVSPRGGIALLNMAKSKAFMDDRDYVVPEDIITSIEPVMTHRIVLNSKAKANGLDEAKIIAQIKNTVAIP